MNFNNFLSMILIVSSLVLLWIAYYSLKRNKLYVSISLLPLIIYVFGYGFEILCTTIIGARFWIRVEYLGISFLALDWIIMALYFTGYKERIKYSNLALLYIIPIITVVLNYTNRFHHLYYKRIYMSDNGIFPIVKIVGGPWYWVQMVYSCILILISLFLFIKIYLKGTSIVKKQILLLITASLIPCISSFVYLLNLLPFNLDLSPFALSFSGIMYSFAILKFKFLKLTPIAFEKVFSNMSDGVIILDSDNNIVNFNSSAKNIIWELNDILAKGKKIETVLKEKKDILKSLSDNSASEALIKIKVNEEFRYYKMNVNNIYEDEEIIGKILTFSDITEIELQNEKLSSNLDFLQTLMDAIPNPIYYKEKNGVYSHCNTAFTEYLGIEKENFLGNTVFDVFEKNMAEVYYEADKSLIDNKGTQMFESTLKFKDNKNHDVIFSKSLVVDKDKNDRGLVGVIIDITEQKRNREKINKLLKLKEAMLKIGYSINDISNINDLLQLILNDVINCIDEKSSGALLLLGEDKSLRIAVAKGYDPEEIKTFSVELDEHFTWFNKGENISKTVIFNDIDKMNSVNMLETSEGLKIKSSISSPIIIDGQLYGFLNIDSTYNNFFDEGDIELMEYMRNQVSLAINKHKLYEKILYLSRYDKLTNVYNRSYFEQLFYDGISNNIEGENEFFVTVFDLNELKLVNDNYGHLAGDELIKNFAKGLKEVVKSSDIIGRFGGDEFVGVFFNEDYESLVNKFEGLSEHFKDNPIKFNGDEIICSYSYGIVNFPKDGRAFDELIKIADDRMYKYKHAVKNKIRNLEKLRVTQGN